jgi:hypothetical protein
MRSLEFQFQLKFFTNNNDFKIKFLFLRQIILRKIFCFCFSFLKYLKGKIKVKVKVKVFRIGVWLRQRPHHYH